MEITLIAVVVVLLAVNLMAAVERVLLQKERKTALDMLEQANHRADRLIENIANRPREFVPGAIPIPAEQILDLTVKPPMPGIVGAPIDATVPPPYWKSKGIPPEIRVKAGGSKK